MLAIDISNYQGMPDDAWWQARKDEGIEHVIVRLGNETQTHVRIFVYQLRKAVEHGFSVAAYVWAYWQLDPWVEIRQLLELVPADLAPHIKFLWVDMEEGTPSVAQVHNWMSAAGDLFGHNRVGIYTGSWWWNGVARLGDSGWMYPLWYSNYNWAHFINWDFESFGGWSRWNVYGKQWQGDPLDTNTFEYPDWVLVDPVVEEEEDMGRIAELEEEVAKLRTIIGYLTNDVADIIEEKQAEHNQNLFAIIEEIRRQAA